MIKFFSQPFLKKGLWIVLAVFLLATQAAAAAELTPQELAAMPTVSITYYTAQDGDPVVLEATPAMSPQGKAYWAMVPPEAFSFPITLTITASDTAPYTFSPLSGETLAVDAGTMDFDGLSTLITAYQNDVMADTYRLYVSTAEMPLIVEPAEVPVYYVDADDNANVLHYEVVLAYYDQSNVITANTGLVPANYSLVGDSSVNVAVDQNGAATPEWVTFYFQAQVMQATVTVYYQDASGNTLASPQTMTLDPGYYVIMPSPSGLPSGYTLSPDSPREVELNIDETGVASTSAITFIYEQLATTGTLTVNYTDENGAPLTSPEMLELSLGAHSVTPNPAYVPSGYVLSASSQSQFDVTVNPGGTLSPSSSVTFVYTPKQVTPATGSLPVFYTDLNGNPLLPSETLSLSQGQHTVFPNDAALPAGYTLSSVPQVEVTVDANGGVSPASVTFLYEKTQLTTTGDLVVRYTDLYGTQLTTPVTLTLNTGVQTVMPDAGLFPAGYQLDASSPAQFSVTVEQNGTVTPSVVSFILSQTPAATAVPTAVPTAEPTLTPVDSYAATNASSVNLRETPSNENSDNILFPSMPQGTQVWVYGTFTLDGREWASINYNGTDCYVWYSLINLVTETSAPVNGTLTVRYKDTNGAVIASEQTVSLSSGNYFIEPDWAHVPAGYGLADGTPSSYDVTVLDDGTTTPSVALFTFAAAVVQPTAVPTATPTVAPLDPTAYPDYTVVDSSAATNASSVNIRSTPVAGGSTNLVSQVPLGTQVWVYGTFTADGTVWAFIRYNGIDCYVWYSLVDLITETAAPTGGTLTVRYQDTNGTAIAADQVVSLSPGAYSVEPNAGRVPEGYSLASGAAPSFDVSVSDNGTVTPSLVVFTFAMAGAEPTAVPTATPTQTPADPTAYADYMEIGASAATNTSSVNIRSTPVAGISSNLVSQVPLGTQVWVYGVFTVDSTAWAYIRYNDTDCYVWYSLISLISETQAPPATADVTVRYVDLNGALLVTPMTLTIGEGTETIVPDTDMFPDGYRLDASSPAQASVTVNGDGTATPNTVTFILSQIPAGTEAPVTADVTVRYADINGTTLAGPVTLTLGPGTHTVLPDAGLYPAGYELNTTYFTQYSVTVSILGAATPNTVTFILSQIPAATEVPVTAGLTVRYLDTNGGQLAPPVTLTLGAGVHTILPDAGLIPAGYQPDPASPAQYSVTVDGTGTATPAVVAFVYTALPVVTATPANMPGENDLPADISPAHPDYTVLGKPAKTNNTSVRIRSTPDSNVSNNILFQVNLGTEVWVHGSFATTDGREWAYIRYATRDCYVWLSLLDVDYSFVTPTPVPTATPTAAPTATPTAVPTATPTASPTVEPTATPTATPTTVPTATPTATVPEENLYVGYAVTLSQVALRDNANFEDNSIITTLAADTLLYINGQANVNGTVWTGAQTYLGESVIGLLPYAAVRTITPGEAQTYIDAYNAANAPTATPTPSPTPTPTQQSGYFLTLGDDVPLRNVPGSQASIAAWIAEDQVVYVTEQVYYEGYAWHVSYYNNISGYIRADQLRAMTPQEVNAYLAQATPTATPEQTVAPYDPYADSSYGYVTTDSVNFRQTPGGTRIGVLNQYAFGLVLGNQTVGSTLWYNINQNGTVGWVSGKYFKVLNLTELTSFLNSSEYLQGIMNTGTGTNTGTTGTSGSATQGQVSAVEDWNVGAWENPSSSLNVSYEPFNPYATPTGPLATPSPTPAPTATFVIGTMIPIEYEDATKETQSSNSWVGLVLGGLALIGGAGGVYAYALTQNKKRKAAARAAAARRAQQGNAQNQNPYARRAAAAPPMAPGQQQEQIPYQRPNPYARPQQNGQDPYAQQQNNTRPNPYTQQRAPYSAQQERQQAPRNPYARPQQTGEPPADSSGDPPRSGRRANRYKDRDDDNA